MRNYILHITHPLDISCRSAQKASGRSIEVSTDRRVGVLYGGCYELTEHISIGYGIPVAERLMDKYNIYQCTTHYDYQHD